jgi:hypothetical protein
MKARYSPLATDLTAREVNAQRMEDAQEKGLLGIQKDAKSGGYLVLEVHRVEGT